MYVALTRAKNELIITRTTDSINAFHQNNTQSPTKQDSDSAYFLEGLPADSVEQKTPSTFSANILDAMEPNDLDLDFGMDFS